MENGTRNFKVESSLYIISSRAFAFPSLFLFLQPLQHFDCVSCLHACASCQLVWGGVEKATAHLKHKVQKPEVDGRRVHRCLPAQEMFNSSKGCQVDALSLYRADGLLSLLPSPCSHAGKRWGCAESCGPEREFASKLELRHEPCKGDSCENALVANPFPISLKLWLKRVLFAPLMLSES